MRRNDSAFSEVDQDQGSTPTVVPFRRGSLPREVKADDERPPDPDDFDPGPTAA